EDFAMSVLGFVAVNSATYKVGIDEEIELDVASLAGIFVLKLQAWSDRGYSTNKDADDIAFIIQNYLEIYRDQSFDYYEDIYTDNHTIFKGGAVLIGIHVSQMLESYPDATAGIVKILSEELNKQEKSLLINQIIETHRALS